MITTAAAVQASGDTEAGWPSGKTFSGSEPAAVRCWSSQRNRANASLRSPRYAAVMARLAVTFVQLTPSRRQDPPGANPPAGRDISDGACSQA